MDSKHDDAISPQVQQAEATNQHDESLEKTPMEGKSAEETKLV
jgi:hypothetical protein